MKDIRQQLLATFQVEHSDHVEQIRSLVALVEKTSEYPAGPELDEAFRRAHSLKGAARAVDLRSVEGLAHRLETLFSRVRQGTLLLDKEVAGAAQQALDASEDCVAAIGENGPTPGVGLALAAIDRVLGLKPAAEAVQPEAPIPTFQPLDTMRVTARNFDGLLRSAGGILAESQRQSQVTAQLNAIGRRIAGMQAESERARGAATPGTSRAFLDSMQRQTRSLSRETAAVRRLHQRSTWATSHLSKQLRQDVWQARLAPVETLLEGYRRMMRDLARDESKEIEFRAKCTSVQADRGVLEALKDPLMHALRNAVSHGIEKPGERTAKGKSRAGLVTLRIETERQRLAIVIEDDGRGLDFSRVAEIAARQGILSEPETQQDLARILFRPGFSTSASITDLSGRGMGLSVVYEAVRRLRGEVELEAREGGGTTLRVSVPLSIATHKLLVVSCSGQRFAIPIHGIERLHRVARQKVETAEGKPVVILRGQAVPLFRLAHLLNLENSPDNPVSDTLQIVILRSKGKRVAIAVDDFLREYDAAIQEVGPAGADNGKISGGTLLEDGTVVLILNPAELLNTSLLKSVGPESQSFSPAAASRPERPPASILVVDDSLTTRTLEKSILEAHGYRVRVAVDGLDALALLRAEKADLVISDVQMPRMNGFELLEAIKKDPQLEQTPVIVVTSQEERDDQQRGLGLGAAAYIVKRKFDQGELLCAIRQIL